MKLGCVNAVRRKDVKQMEQTNCKSVFWAAEFECVSVCECVCGCMARNGLHRNTVITCSVTREQSPCHEVLLL